ncbi:hypothetical protein CMI42_05235 [Candidatus Pacearchaeota archaeon]|nr:hypothetical protein [Candidatus Pacearchaeota archaeon]|tara:strand:- start:340 stop:789 length:450 start_codon:yes stop_codon:yes gene_type:complete
MLENTIEKYKGIRTNNMDSDRDNPYSKGFTSSILDDTVKGKNPTNKYLVGKFDNSNGNNPSALLDRVSYSKDDIGNDPKAEPVLVSIWNFREWEILSWAKAMIGTYKANKGDNEAKKNYLDAKDKMREVFEGKHKDSRDKIRFPIEKEL